MGFDVSTHADAFALLGHQDRLGIVAALFAAEGDVSFSSLREEVGVYDTGRFHYHLSELQPAFVEGGDDGYRLTRRGRRAARVVLRESLTEDPDAEEIDREEACVRCGGEVVLAYGDQFGTVACRDCGHWFVRTLLPPAAVATADPERVATVLDHRARGLRRAGNRGVCPLCGGVMVRELATEPDHFGHGVHVTYDCERCDARFGSTVGAAHVGHPDVVAFARDHGVPVAERPLWTLAFAFDPVAVALVDDAPRAELRVSADDATLSLTVGTDGGVESAERT